MNMSRRCKGISGISFKSITTNTTDIVMKYQLRAKVTPRLKTKITQD